MIKTKKSIIFIFMFFVALLLPNNSQALTLWFENYENFNINNYDDAGSGNQYTVDNFKPHTGSYSIHTDPNYQVMWMKKNFTPQPSSAWVWLTYWLWIPENYTFGGPIHLISMNYGYHYVQLDFRPYEGIDQLVLIVYRDSSIQLDSPRPISYFQNKWTKIQQGVQYSTKSVQIWVDDIKVYDHSNVDQIETSQQIQTVMVRLHRISDYVNSAEIYYDDISIDTGERPTNILINEDFENTQFDGTPEGYIGNNGYCINGGYECSVAAGTCTSCSGVTNVARIQSSIKHSGNYALKGSFVSTAGAAGFKICDLTSGCAYKYNVIIPTKFYIRFYIYWDPAFRFNSANKIFTRPFNFYFTIRGLANKINFQETSDNTPYGAIGIYSSYQGAKNVCGNYFDDLANIPEKRQCDYGDGSEWVIDLTNTEHIGWWYFEVMLDLTENKFSLWAKRPRDTSVTQIYNNMPWSFSTRREEIHWMWLNDVGYGKGSGDVYIDDVVIGSAYIGPISKSDTTPPAAPKGVMII